MTTHTLAMEAQPIGGESPLVALVKLALAPLVCTLSLLACLYACGQSFTFAYQLLAISAFLISAQVFGELPLSNGRHGYAMFPPDRAILGKWLFVVAVLLLLAFATKFSGLYSRRVTLTWFALTPFALGAAQAFAVYELGVDDARLVEVAEFADADAAMDHSLGVGQPSRRSFGAEVDQLYLALGLRIRHPSRPPYNGIRGWHPKVEYPYIVSISRITFPCNGERNSRRLGQG